MNETTFSHGTTTVVFVTTSQAVAIGTAATYIVDKDIIIGAAVAGACVFTIVIFLLVWCIKSKRSNTNLPPTLPDPYTMPRIVYTESSITSHQSEIEVPSRKHPNHQDSVQHTWEARKPVIHSSPDYPESDRTSYEIMIGSRRISIGPPSPEQTPRRSTQANNKGPPPVTCKSPSGYINTQFIKQGQSPGSSNPPRKGPNFNTNENVSDELPTSEDEHDSDNYENVEEIILAERHKVQSNVQIKDKSSITNLSSRQLADHHLPDLLTSSVLNQNRKDNHPVENSRNATTSHREDTSSSDSDTPVSPKDGGSPTSYVNVDQYKKRSPVKESVIINLSGSKFPELVINNSPFEIRSQTRSKPSLIPKPKLNKQQRVTGTNIDDTYQINADLLNIDNSGQDNTDNSGQDNTDESEKDKVNQSNRKLSSSPKKNNTDSSTSTKISLPTTEKNTTHSGPTKFLTTGKPQTKDAQDKLNQRQRSHSHQDDIGVYQNYNAISASESTLPQKSAAASPAHSTLKVIYSRATSESDTPSEFELSKPSLDPSRKMGHAKKTNSQQSTVPAGLSRSPVRDITLGSSPSIGSSEELHKIRSNLRKVN